MHRSLKLFICAAFITMIPLLSGCIEDAFYYPDRVVYDVPARHGLGFEEVFFSSADGTKLSGWFIPAAGYVDTR